MQGSFFKVGKLSGILGVLNFNLKKHCTYQYIVNTSSNFLCGTATEIIRANISSPETFTVTPVVVCISCSLLLYMTEPYIINGKNSSCEVKVSLIWYAGIPCSLSSMYIMRALQLLYKLLPCHFFSSSFFYAFLKVCSFIYFNFQL